MSAAIMLGSGPLVEWDPGGERYVYDLYGERRTPETGTTSASTGDAAGASRPISTGMQQFGMTVMPIRHCTDRSGTEWEIFEVAPLVERRTVARMPEAFRAGWLCFQSANERRRLAPIPAGWREWDDDTLLDALEQGQLSSRRTPLATRTQPRIEVRSRSGESMPPRAGH